MITNLYNSNTGKVVGGLHQHRDRGLIYPVGVGVGVWDRAAGRHALLHSHNRPITAMAISRGGNLIVSAQNSDPGCQVRCQVLWVCSVLGIMNYKNGCCGFNKYMIRGMFQKSDSKWYAFGSRTVGNPDYYLDTVVTSFLQSQVIHIKETFPDMIKLTLNFGETDELSFNCHRVSKTKINIHN